MLSISFLHSGKSDRIQQQLHLFTGKRKKDIDVVRNQFPVTLTCQIPPPCLHLLLPVKNLALSFKAESLINHQ